MRPSFQSKIFQIVKKIPKGKVFTYKEVARRARRPKAYRAVGNILNKNTEPDEIPCYKVVRSDGRLAKGYKFGGPAAQKCRLVADGVRFTPSGKIKNFKITFQHS